MEDRQIIFRSTTNKPVNLSNSLINGDDCSDSVKQGRFSHAEGKESAAYGWYSHADGYKAIANNNRTYIWNSDKIGHSDESDGTYSIWTPFSDTLEGVYINGNTLKYYFDDYRSKFNGDLILSTDNVWTGNNNFFRYTNGSNTNIYISGSSLKFSSASTLTLDANSEFEFYGKAYVPNPNTSGSYEQSKSYLAATTYYATLAVKNSVSDYSYYYKRDNIASQYGNGTRPVYSAANKKVAVCAASAVLMNTGNSSCGDDYGLIYIDSNKYANKSTSTLGSSVSVIFISKGKLISSTSTVGSSIKPVYINNGAITSFSNNIGTSKKFVIVDNGSFSSIIGGIGLETAPIYIKNGKFSICDSIPSDGLGSTEVPSVTTTDSHADSKIATYITATKSSSDNSITLTTGKSSIWVAHTGGVINESGSTVSGVRSRVDGIAKGYDALISRITGVNDSAKDGTSTFVKSINVGVSKSTNAYSASLKYATDSILTSDIVKLDASIKLVTDRLAQAKELAYMNDSDVSRITSMGTTSNIDGRSYVTSISYNATNNRLEYGSGKVDEASYPASDYFYVKSYTTGSETVSKGWLYGEVSVSNIGISGYTILGVCGVKANGANGYFYTAGWYVLEDSAYVQYVNSGNAQLNISYTIDVLYCKS